MIRSQVRESIREGKREETLKVSPVKTRKRRGGSALILTEVKRDRKKGYPASYIPKGGDAIFPVGIQYIRYWIL